MTPPAANSTISVQKGSELPQPRKFTFEEYCTYEDGTGNRYELVNGYLHLIAPPTSWHFLVCEFLVYVFNRLFQATDPQLWAAKEVGIKIHDNTCRIVDVCVNGKKQWTQLFESGETRPLILTCPPLLVVEVASSNEKEDYGPKFQDYASLGIPEYWIVNRRREHVRVCNLAASGNTYLYRDFVKGAQIVSQVLPQLKLTVYEVLQPAPVQQLSEQDQAQKAAEREALVAKNATVTSERDALEAENAAMKQQLEQLKAMMQARGLDFPH